MATAKQVRTQSPGPTWACRPVALDLGFFELRWYSLAYLAGIFIGYWYLLKLIKQPGAPMARRHADDLVFYAALGIILGGRLGYVLFYNLRYYLQNPLDILKLWDGGMTFHGGVIGTSLGILYLARKEKLQWLRVHDYVACCVPFGLFFGRLANFVNHELWGAPTNVPWAVRFPEIIARHAGARPAAAPEPALRSGARGPRPVRDPLVDVLEDPGALRAGQARRRLHLLLRHVPLRRRVRPRARRAAGRLRAGDRPAHGPVAVAADDPRRRSS